MERISVHDFVRDLKLNKTFTSKQSVVIDNIYIYFNNLKVYKVVIVVNPSMIKKAKRLGIESPYLTIFLDDIPIKCDEIHKDVSKGKYIAIYNLSKSEYSVFPGETSEEEQIQKIRESKLSNYK